MMPTPYTKLSKLICDQLDHEIKLLAAFFLTLMLLLRKQVFLHLTMTLVIYELKQPQFLGNQFLQSSLMLLSIFLHKLKTGHLVFLICHLLRDKILNNHFQTLMMWTLCIQLWKAHLAWILSNLLLHTLKKNKRK